MATPSGAEVLENYYGELLRILNALSKPVEIAANLLSKCIITKEMHQKVSSLPDYERNHTILEAVLKTVKADERRLLVFIDILTEVDELSLADDVVTKMRKMRSELNS